MSKRSFQILGFMFFSIGLVALITYWWTRPTILRLAIPVQLNETARFTTAFAYRLRQDGGSLRVRVTMRNSMDEVLQAIEKQEVDLAILRNDFTFPQDSSVVAIMQRLPLALITHSQSQIVRFTDLTHKRVGIVSRSEQAAFILERLLREFNVNPNSVTIIRIAQDNIAERVKSLNLDAIFMNSPPESPSVREALQNYSKLYDDKITFIPILENEAIAKRVPYFEPFTLLQGAYGGNPPLPTHNIRTSTTSHILVARNGLSSNIIGEFTEELFQKRASLAIEHPSALRLQAPDIEANAAFPVHSGSYAHFTDSRETFLEQYSDALYILLMVVSLVGTIVAGFLGVRKVKGVAQPHKTEVPLEHLARLLKAVGLASSQKELDEITHNGEELLIECLEDDESNSDSSRLSVILATLERLRFAVSERAKILQVHPLQS